MEPWKTKHKKHNTTKKYDDILIYKFCLMKEIEWKDTEKKTDKERMSLHRI